VKNRKRKQFIIDRFGEFFGGEPELWTRAPGRVELLGSHTDYNLGYVLTMAIDRDIWVAANRRDDDVVICSSIDLHSIGEFRLDDIVFNTEIPWLNYVQGVAYFLKELGYKITGFNAIVHSTVPLGAGLSSSAALEMSILEMFKIVNNIDLSSLVKAKIGQEAENNFVGVNTGILDQYSSVFGREDQAMLLDTKKLTNIPVDIPSSIQVVVCDTNTKRILVGSEYDDRREQCESGVTLMNDLGIVAGSLGEVKLKEFEYCEPYLPEVIAKRCRFIIEENERVLEMADALPSLDKYRMKELYTNSFIGARDLYEIITTPMEEMFNIMNDAPGNIAARQSGAGFGGSMVALVEKELVNEFRDYVYYNYENQTGIKPFVYPVRASMGSGVLSLK